MSINNNKTIDLQLMEKRIKKLTNRLWAGIFLLSVMAVAGVFMFANFYYEQLALALAPNYSKNTGDLLTANEWNTLSTDFVSTETDPTVPANIKDGITWSEVSGVPAGFADGVDDSGGSLVCTTRTALDRAYCLAGEILTGGGCTFDCTCQKAWAPNTSNNSYYCGGCGCTNTAHAICCKIQ